MPPIVNAQQVCKTYGTSPLFQKLSFSISEGDRIGLIGPNGAGKSTLLQILARQVVPDSGDVAVRRGIRMALVMQHSEFSSTQTVKSVARAAMQSAKVPETERDSVMAETLGRAGF